METSKQQSEIKMRHLPAVYRFKRYGRSSYNHKHQVLEYINVESVNRLNHYQNDSNCMRRIRGRKFCICESRIVKSTSQTKDNAKEKQNKIKKTKKEVQKLTKPKKKKVDDSLYELPDMQPEINEDIEIISV